MICNVCGKNLTGSITRKKRNGAEFPYYHCQHGCKERFRADLANTEFEIYLATFQIPDEVLLLYNAVLEDVAVGNRN